MGKKKDKAVNYNAGRIVIDIVMLFLGLIFIIGTIAGKGDDIAAGFVRIIGAARTHYRLIDCSCRNRVYR